MKRLRNNSAFTIVEIVVGVIIIGILATILIPVLVKQADEAKVSKAKRDIEEIANAQERAAIDLGYYLRLYVLDDVKDGDTIGLGQDNDITDGIADEINNQFYKRPQYMFIRTTSGSQDFLADALAEDLFDNLSKVGTNSESAYQWKGPYYNIHKDETVDETKASLALQAIPAVPRSLNATPTDPWGNDYLLFTRLGLVSEPEGEIWDDARGQTEWSANTKVFDRPVVLSLGPNGLPGNGIVGDPNYQFGKGDDLVRAFGY